MHMCAFYHVPVHRLDHALEVSNNVLGFCPCFCWLVMNLNHDGLVNVRDRVFRVLSISYASRMFRSAM